MFIYKQNGGQNLKTNIFTHTAHNKYVSIMFGGSQPKQ